MRPDHRPFFLTVLALTASLVIGCEDKTIRSYDAPKDPAATTAMPGPVGPTAAAPSTTTTTNTGGASGLAWQLPEGWRESAEARPMRLATFEVGEGDDALEIALSAFPQDVGGALANVNRWRGQLGLPPITQDELPAAVTALHEDGSSDAVVVDLTGRAEHADLGETDVRMIVAMVPAPGQTWFLKAVGLPDQVEAHRASFLAFARTLPPTPDSMAPQPATAAAPPADPHGVDHSQPHWTTPEHWETDPKPSTMLKAAYFAKPEGGGEARITLMTLPGDGGGALLNINRWRGQVGLESVQSLQDQPVRRLSVDGHPGAMIDLVGTPPGADAPLRTIVALVALQQETWFIKMTGDDPTVEAELPNFQALLQSIHIH